MTLVQHCVAASDHLALEFLHLVAGAEAADALDLPLQLDAGILQHLFAHRLAEEFKIVAGPTSIKIEERRLVRKGATEVKPEQQQQEQDEKKN